MFISAMFISAIDTTYWLAYHPGDLLNSAVGSLVQGNGAVRRTHGAAALTPSRCRSPHRSQMHEALPQHEVEQ